MNLNFLSLLSVALCAVLGIDYGAEYSKSALVAPQIPFEILLTPESKRKDASGLVFRTKQNDIERFYGSTGLQYTSRFPDSSLYYLKGLAGQPFDSPAVEEYNKVHPGLSLVKNKRNGISFSFKNQEYPVEQVIAMSFKDIKSRAQAELKSKLGNGIVNNVAISVPANFNMAQRRALSDAASLAELQLISLVNDGVAVAVNYASTRQFPELQWIVVYDMGSESTSSTLLSVQDVNATTTITVEGFSSVPAGGKTLTLAVRDILIKQFRDKTGVTDELGPRVLNRLWKEAERAKAVLSANSEVSVFIESLYKDHDFSTTISRKQLETACKAVIDQVVTPLAESLHTFEGEQIAVKDLSSVILAGGGTRVPFVQKQLTEFAGPILSKNVNADEAAVLGTTLRGVGISGIFRSKPMDVVDKSLRTYSVNDGTETFELFKRGSALDTSKTFNFLATEDLTISLLEDDSPQLTWNFPLLPEMTKSLESSTRVCGDDPEVAVKFTLTNSGVVELREATVRCKTVPVEDSEEVDTKTVTRNLNARRVDTGVSPLTNADREELSYGIRQLEKQDSDRLRKQTLHNILESLCYKIRELQPEEARAHEILEELEDDMTVVQLSERLKEAEALYEQYRPVDETKLFASDLQEALDAAGLVADLQHPEAVARAIAGASLEQLKKIKLTQQGELYDEFRDTLSKAVSKREAQIASAAAEADGELEEERELDSDSEEPAKDEL